MRNDLLRGNGKGILAFPSRSDEARRRSTYLTALLSSKEVFTMPKEHETYMELVRLVETRAMAGNISDGV